MPTVTHSNEANAAHRFIEATRNVDLAFRAVRGKAEDEISDTEHAVAVSRLDRALDELSRAQELFDLAVSAHSTRQT
ncbi:hypothetical protein FAZ69_14470 [Trinickia terrae]|uniref:Uncharacterized protein n=1 Tax=Trinickia terrae TaxID=2571161 RepID=A0A4U1I4X2_9BURK|nr:hypothetical protein [Trinickia terrae]TKC88348.1 hypothetical protein FAZ69_14470 [Trinickia terrae]